MNDKPIQRTVTVRLDMKVINRLDKCARDRKYTRVDVLKYCIKHGLAKLEEKK